VGRICSWLPVRTIKIIDEMNLEAGGLYMLTVPNGATRDAGANAYDKKFPMAMTSVSRYAYKLGH
jgi:hypothetical protein